MGHAIKATDLTSGTITARADDLNFSGGSNGDVWTVQADGSVAMETFALNDGQLIIMGISKNGYATSPGVNTIFRVNSGATGATVYGSGITSIYFNGTSDYASFTVYSAAASPSVVAAKLYGYKLGVTY